jgi:hypothetical protein
MIVLPPGLPDIVDFELCVASGRDCHLRPALADRVVPAPVPAAG